MGIEKPMIVGDNKGTADEFSKIKSKFGHITAYMTSYTGNITLVDKILKIVAHIKTSLFPAGVKVTCNIRRRKV